MPLRWKYLLLILLSTFFPVLALAAASDTMSFAPPASDISVAFLGNLFGLVDGVLHGTGSQIMGAMFTVFNAAVLGLGGIVMMYIILVSTMNTAHEGQMLGQKWSSIWVPVRATIGLSFLIPKTSGYCLMQIFVMWVVLQGVGVADKIWSGALDYLNDGGVIVQANMAPAVSTSADNFEVLTGAANMLYGQVCMVALQKQLETLRTGYLAAKEKGSGACSGSPISTLVSFCGESVPEFADTVDPLTAYNDASDTATSFSVQMPNITDSSSIYASLSGICGVINWNAVASSDSLSAADAQQKQDSRAAAVEQMYLDLLPTAKSIVNNDPQINTDAATTDMASAIGVNQLGVPQDSNGAICTGGDCPYWGADVSISEPVLLAGTELQNAVADYNAIMASALKLISDDSNIDTSVDEREFINKAKASGWIKAGSYFFQLAVLNGSSASSTTTDSDTGLSNNTMSSTGAITSAFGGNSCAGRYQKLCEFFTLNAVAAVQQVASLLDGTGLDGGSAALMTPPKYSNGVTAQTGAASTTVFGYAANAALITLADQAGASTTVDVTASSNWSTPTSSYEPVGISFNCSGTKNWGAIGKCMFNNIVKNFWGSLIRPLLDDFLVAMKDAMTNITDIFIIKPMTGFILIFQNGIDILTTEGINPVIALAKMGQAYIDFSMDVYVALAIAAIPGSFFPPFYALFMCAAPIFFAWEGIMIGIGFTTTYFVPFLPYMIFTFGAIAWLIIVIESMVAAPIVALGIAHPEGHDALGKSEAGFMILLNVFLRPGMMIIGYIAGISLSFVGIWVMSSGFNEGLSYMQSNEMWGAIDAGKYRLTKIAWTKYFGMFFAALLYTMLYLTIVQQSFTLIAVLPDKILRWIGGQQESVGQDAHKWGDEAKGKIGEAGTKTGDAGSAATKGMVGGIGDSAKFIKDKGKAAFGGGNATSKGTKKE